MIQLLARTVANYISESWYLGYIEYRNSERASRRRFGLLCRAKAVIISDKELNYQINGIEY